MDGLARIRRLQHGEDIPSGKPARGEHARIRHCNRYDQITYSIEMELTNDKQRACDAAQAGRQWDDHHLGRPARGQTCLDLTPD
jgi:hypothetical protein